MFERDWDATSHVHISLTILKSNYQKPVLRVQLKKVASIHRHSNGVRSAGGLISRELGDRNHVI